MTLPKVSIVIPTYRINSKPYLDLCIDAIRNLDYPKELLDINIISPTTYIPAYDNVKNLHHPDNNRSFAQAVNYGINNSNQSSKFVFLLSDDTIPTRQSLKNMVMTCADHMLFMQALSNCDNHWLYNLVFMLNGKPIMQRFFRMEDVGDDVHHMKNASSLYQPGLLFPHTLCTYASLIPRRVIDRVGLFDERFRDGYEDSDYIYRCKKADVRPAVCLNALVWHFGGVTTSDVVTPELSEKNRRLFGEKWINE